MALRNRVIALGFGWTAKSAKQRHIEPRSTTSVRPQHHPPPLMPARPALSASTAERPCYCSEHRCEQHRDPAAVVKPTVRQAPKRIEPY